MEVLCGYTLAKLLRSLASTFQSKDGQIYKVEDVLPSYMLKTTLLWILDPEDRFHTLYPHTISPFIQEPVSTYSSDVLQLSSELLQHRLEDFKMHDVCFSIMQCEWMQHPSYETDELYGFFTWYMLRWLRDHSSGDTEKSLRAIIHKCSHGSDYLSSKERVLPYTSVTRCKGKRRQNGIDVAQFIQDQHRGSLQNDQTAYVDKAEIHSTREFHCQYNDDDLKQNGAFRKTDMVHIPYISDIGLAQMIQYLVGTSLQNSQVGYVDEIEIIYSRRFYCQDRAGDLTEIGTCRNTGKNSYPYFRDIDQVRRMSDLYRRFLDNGHEYVDETRMIYNRVSICPEHSGGMKQNSANRNSGKVSYPDISEETARRARLWAVRILHLLPQLLEYSSEEVKGLRNYYLPQQQIYSKDVGLATAFCEALTYLIQ